MPSSIEHGLRERHSRLGRLDELLHLQVVERSCSTRSAGGHDEHESEGKVRRGADGTKPCKEAW